MRVSSFPRAVWLGILVLLLGLGSGCGSTQSRRVPDAPGVPAARPGVGQNEPGRPSGPVPRQPLPPRQELPRVPDWEAFSHTQASLDGQIEGLAAELRGGGAGGNAGRLASLRLASRGAALLRDGRPESSVDVLDRAVAGWGGNGFAYLYLSYAHHQLGHSRNAWEFARRAESSLPRERWVLAELAGLKASIRASNPALPAR